MNMKQKYIFGSNNYEELVSKYPNKLVITLGEKKGYIQ